MDRREFIEVGAGVLASASLAPSGVLAADRGGRKKANLLIIHSDEHNFRTLGCYRDTLAPKQAFMWGKQEDPDELVNFATRRECRSIVRELGKAMAAYHKQHTDPSLDQAKIRYDLAWAVGEKAEYDAAAAPPHRAPGKGKTRVGKKGHV